MKSLLLHLKISLYLWSIILLILFLFEKIPSSSLEIKSPPLRQVTVEIPELPPFPIQLQMANLSLSAMRFASLDTTSGEYLLGRDVSTKHPTASTSKLMLAWVTLQHCQSAQLVTVSQSFNTGTVLGIKPGEVLSVKDLLSAALIPSANDAAVNLAVGCFGSVDTAVAAMNSQAERWHLKNTHFTNPTGLDQSDNYISAADLVKLAYLTTKDQLIREITSTPQKTITASDGTAHILTSTNKLLGVNGINGIKTGSTELAGENLVVSTSISSHRVITAVLGSTDRYKDTLQLIAEISRVYRWQVESDLNFGTALGISNPTK